MRPPPGELSLSCAHYAHSGRQAVKRKPCRNVPSIADLVLDTVTQLWLDNDMTTNTTNTAALYDYNTAEFIRPAAAEELAASIEAATKDGGAGVILVADQGDRRCYVA